MKKQILSMLFIMVVLAGLLTTAVFAASITKNYDANQGSVDLYYSNGTKVTNLYTVSGNTKLYIKAEPKDGYEVDEITVSYRYGMSTRSVPVTRDGNNGTFTMPACDVTVKVTFKKIIYNIYSAPTQGGTFTVSKTSATAGETIKVTATPDEGNEVYDIKVYYYPLYHYPVPVEVNEDGTFEMPYGDVWVWVVFEKNTYTVTWYDEDGTTVLGTAPCAYGSTPVFTGTTPTKNADAASTYVFYEWIPVSGLDENGNVIGDASFKASYTAEQRDYDPYLLASLIMLYNQKFKITASASEGGSITPDGITYVNYGKTITYTITPDEGYTISAVLVDGKDVGAVPTYTFKNVNKNHTITAVFEKIKWQNPFTDVSEDDWFYEDVKFVSENGLMEGVSETEFAPYSAVTRAMLVTVLWRMEGKPAVDYQMPFDDVADNQWYTEAIRWAASEGIVKGYDDGTFRPETEITREQVMAIFHRYASYKNLASDMIVAMIPPYNYSTWAENDIIWADMVGLTDGIGKDIFDMTETADRAELAAYLRLFCENVK